MGYIGVGCGVYRAGVIGQGPDPKEAPVCLGPA